MMLANLSLAPALQAVGWALLHLVWQGTAIAVSLALLLALLPSRSASVRYALSCAALALVVVVAVLTGLRSYAASGHAAAPLAGASSAPHAATTVAAPEPLHVSPSPSLEEIVVATFAPARVPLLPDPMRAASAALPAIVTLWMAGVTLLSLRLIVQWMQARRLVRVGAQPACEPWLAMARRLATALGVRRAVRLVESTAVQVPAVVGLLRPVILLPANTLTGLLPGQLEMILAHELAHIRRHDFLVNLLQAAVETLLFYHPAVWWISRQVRIEREHCCDDLAIEVCGSPLQYARALTRLEELRGEPLRFALSAGGGSLLLRIRRVVAGPAVTAGPVRGVTALALLLGLLLAFAGPSLTAIARPQAGAAPHPQVAAVHLVGLENAATRAAAAMAHAAKACADCKDRGEAAEAAAKAMADAATTLTESAAEPAIGDVAVNVGNLDPAPIPDLDPDPNVEPDPQPNSTAAIASGHLRLTVDELIALRSQGVTTADLLDMRSVFPSVEVREVASMFAVGATPEYVRRMEAAGIRVRSAKEAQGMAAVGVTPELIAGLRAAGLEVKSAGAATGLAAVGVTPELVRSLRAAGLSVDSAEEAKSLAAVGVTPDFVRDLKATGLKLASAGEVKNLAAVGVTADYVREMREAGVAIRDAADAKSLIVVGVTPEFVRRLARAGYRNLSISDLCRLGAAGVSDGFVEEMSQYRTH